MLDYLNKEIGCRTAILGIQPVSLEVDGAMSEEVKRSVDHLIEDLGEILEQL
jgi:Ni,Fe-hydrogenase maturation factor